MKCFLAHAAVEREEQVNCVWRYTSKKVRRYSQKLGAALAAGALAILCSCSQTNASADNRAHAAAKVRKDRKPAPEFTLKDANGASVSLSNYRGKVVLLNFWATWCGPCGLEIPWFTEFEQQYKSKGFEVVGISMDEEGWSVIKPYIETRKINYRVVLGNDSVAQLYGGVDSLPTTFIIDRDGMFAYPPHVGLVGKNEYQNEIQSLIDVPQTNAANRYRSTLPAALLTGPAK